MKRIIALLLTIICVLIIFPSCTSEETENENLTYYMVKNDGYPMDEIIKKYNLYCDKTLDKTYKIEIKEFDSEDEMLTKMSTEMMAGTGPDIFTLDQCLPFEKLMKNNSFADIKELAENNTSEDKLNFSDYNQLVIQCGQYNGRQYIVPCFYEINTLTALDTSAEKYNLPLENGTSLTFSQMDITLKSYLEDENRVDFMYNDGIAYEELFYDFINSYVDLQSGEVSFESDDFKKGLENIEKIRDDFGKWDNFEDLLFKWLIDGGSFRSRASINHTTELNGNKCIIYSGFNKSEEDIVAEIQFGVAVNSNSKHSDKALEFIKYLLSDDSQQYFCGNKENSNLWAMGGISHPVNNTEFEHAIEIASNFAYDDENKYINGTDNEYMQSYIDLVRNANKCRLYTDTYESYYSRKVVGNIIEDYLDERISKDKFIRQLTSATEIYLNE